MREWDTLIDRFPSNSLTRMVDGVRTLCNPPSLADQVREFVLSHPLPGGGRTVDQILERLAVSEAFGEREGASLADTLRRSLGLD
jgi:hypothetical protein